MRKSSYRYTHALSSAQLWEKSLQTKTETYWLRRGALMQLALFKDMATRVPAYKKFLKLHHVDTKKIVTHKDLALIPVINKDNYLRKYKLTELCWDGELSGVHNVISSTSGSTGEPFYFPRTATQDDQYALVAELYLRANFAIEKKRTLYINAFPLGVWIGGIFTYAAITKVAERGKYPLSIINPGINIPAILQAVLKFQGEYEQIIIGSYGPFLKDVLDEGKHSGINWSKLNLGFIFSAEGFSEEFRAHVLTHTTMKDKLRASLNHYGTVDLGTMSYETPVAILAKQQILSSTRLRNDIFGDPYKSPTLTQYIPELFFFEEDPPGRLLVSGYSGLPLVRYDLNDNGNVFTKASLTSRMQKEGFSLFEAAKKINIVDTVWDLPFVQVFERSDFSVSYYAFQIYPETIKRALSKKPATLLTSGKFSMKVAYNASHKQRLMIHIEMLPRVNTIGRAGVKILLSVIHAQLQKESSEYAKSFSEKGGGIYPVLVMHRHASPAHFTSGTKQKWVK